MSRLTLEELLPYCASHPCQPPWDGVSPREDVVCSGARELEDEDEEEEEDEEGDEDEESDEDEEDEEDTEAAHRRAAERELRDLERYCGCGTDDPFIPYVNQEYLDFRFERGLDSVRRAQDREAELDTLAATLDPDALCRYTAERHPYGGLDPFVASTLMALVFAGAVPISSCCGWPGHFMQHPLVAFWCPPEALPRIHAAACQADVWLYGEGQPGRNPHDPPALVVAHEHDVHALRRFAAALTELVLAEAPPAAPESGDG